MRCAARSRALAASSMAVARRFAPAVRIECKTVASKLSAAAPSRSFSAQPEAHEPTVLAKTGGVQNLVLNSLPFMLASAVSKSRSSVRPVPEQFARKFQIEDGYAVQELAVKEVIRLNPELRIGAWKVGATSQVAQKTLGVSEPFSGPVLSSRLHSSPHTLDTGAVSENLKGVEAEFALQLNGLLESVAKGRVFTEEEVAAAVTAVVPAMELAGTRFDTVGGAFPAAPFVVADFGGNSALVLGAACTDWRALDLASHPVVVRKNGAQAASGTGAAVLGHPLRALTWFVNRCAAHGVSVPAGTVVSTGTCTGLTPAAKGDALVADFGSLGAVELTLK